MALPDIERFIRVEGEMFASDHEIIGGKPGSIENLRAVSVHNGPDHATKRRLEQIRREKLLKMTGSSEEIIM